MQSVGASLLFISLLLATGLCSPSLATTQGAETPQQQRPRFDHGSRPEKETDVMATDGDDAAAAQLVPIPGSPTQQHEPQVMSPNWPVQPDDPESVYITEGAVHRLLAEAVAAAAAGARATTQET